MKTMLASFLSTLCALCLAQTPPGVDVQVKTAVLAAPLELREGAMVYGYNDAGDFVVIRKGTNTMVCLADDPKQKGLNVSCYHKDLEPFMQRGRDLKKEGKSFDEIFNIREEEVRTGKLKMPAQPATLFVYNATDDNYDSTTGTVEKGYLRYVVYIPYATSETTGLPLKPDIAGMPWIMDPGTHRAHIMITPAQ